MQSKVERKNAFLEELKALFVKYGAQIEIELESVGNWGGDEAVPYLEFDYEYDEETNVRKEGGYFKLPRYIDKDLDPEDVKDILY